MKEIYFLFAISIFTALKIHAQVPQLMSYQAVVRNNNILVANSPVSIRISILQGSTAGSSVYSEIHNTITNSNGLAAISIGGGTSIYGSFSAINWESGSYFVQAETDPNGGNNYNIVATNQLLSVPYALFSEKSGTSGSKGDTGDIGLPGIAGDTGGIGAQGSTGLTGSQGPIGPVGPEGPSGTFQPGTVAGQMLYWNGTAWLTVTPGRNNQKLSLCNGVPTWGLCPVYCGGSATSVVNVTNPTTGIIWMDRNLGAARAATNSSDASAYGDLYQWGRRTDGHQCRNSPSINTVSSSDLPANGYFIIPVGNFGDWRSPQNSGLWQGVSGVNNPCPFEYRLPTQAELIAERLSWNSQSAIGAFASPLKLPLAGMRLSSIDFITAGDGNYWSSTVNGNNTNALYFNSGNADIGSIGRAFGLSVRCLKDNATGTIAALGCGTATNSGNLTNGILASNVSTTIAYGGGNGGTYDSQSVSSTGVSGLTAGLSAGTFANGPGTLVYSISGTPATAGIAKFDFVVGGQSCSFAVSVAILVGTINALNCGSTTNSGILRESTAASNVSVTFGYDGGNGGVYAAQSINSTAVLGLTANLTAGAFTNGSGNLVFTITGTPASNGAATFTFTVGGQTCSFVLNVAPLVGTINALDCTTATTNGTLTEGSFASNVSTSISYAGGNGGLYSAQSFSSSGVTGLTANLSPGPFAFGSGNLVFTVIGQPATSGAATFAVTAGGQACSFVLNVAPKPGTINTLNCSTPTETGTLLQGVVASNVSTTISYTGGDGGPYAAQSVSSIAITGLTATLVSGNFVSGAGSLTYSITGIPSGSGNAIFALNVGGQTCTLVRIVGPALAPYYCTGIPTMVVEVVNPITGKVWMDRNLGASQAAISSTDANAYGDLYQWGRGADGHQCRNSAMTSTLSSTEQPGHENFIFTNSNLIYDWRSPKNDNLWQGINGVNNPCPTAYRLPTRAELNAERASWSSQKAAGAFASPLKLPTAGRRNYNNGLLSLVDSEGDYWSGTFNGDGCDSLGFNSSSAYMYGSIRAWGFSVRCLKN